MLVNGTKLSYKLQSESDYKELENLTSIPDISVGKEKVENSTLASTVKTYEFGVGDAPELEFGFTTDKETDDMTQYLALLALDTANTIIDLKLEYKNGFMVSFPAQINVTLGGGELNSLITYTVNCSLTGAITQSKN